MRLQQLKYIPANWATYEPKAIARWMQSLPTVKNLETVAKIDLKYQKMQEQYENHHRHTSH